MASFLGILTTVMTGGWECWLSKMVSFLMKNSQNLQRPRQSAENGSWVLFANFECVVNKPIALFN